MATNKDQLASVRLKDLQFSPSHHIVEQVASLCEAHKSLGPVDRFREMGYHLLEFLPVHRPVGGKGKGLKVLLARMSGRYHMFLHPQAKKEVGVYLAVDGFEQNRTLIVPSDLGLDFSYVLPADQISLIDHDYIGSLELHPCCVSHLGILDACVGVHDADDTIHTNLRQVIFHLVDQGIRLSHTRRLDNDVIWMHRYDNLGHRCLELTRQFTADTTAC